MSPRLGPRTWVRSLLATLAVAALVAGGTPAAVAAPARIAADVTAGPADEDPLDDAATAVAALETASDVLDGTDAPSLDGLDGLDGDKGEGLVVEPPATTPDDVSGNGPEDTAGPGSEVEPTLALRDLALLRNDLPANRRGEADALLARPTDGAGDQYQDGYTVPEATPVCSDVVCVHYVDTRQAGKRDDRPPLTDADANDIPDYVELTVDTLTHVHETYVGAGYRAPLPDGTLGGDDRVDIYLEEIGTRGLYGYCTTDEVLSQSRDTWAYCVLDNDYSADEFPAHTPQQNLQVTAAHEYFHAVQFGYDIGEDAWFMEATATWAEDELYDRVNDNRSYLDSSPLTQPRRSMDQFTGTFHYGTWIFFRYLTEAMPAASGSMPTLVRAMWRRADNAPGGPGNYSLEAVRKTLQRRGTSLTEAFARFTQANRMPGRAYDEGSHYPKAPLAKTVRLTSGYTRASQYRTRLDHLSSATVRYVPSKGLGGRTWILRLQVDLSRRFRGTAAVVTVKKAGSRPSVRLISLDSDGDGRINAKFTRGKTTWVEVTLVNAGDDFACRKGTRFSCAGHPRDDGRLQRLDARAIRR